MRTDVFASLDKKALRFIKIKKTGCVNFIQRLHKVIGDSLRTQISNLCKKGSV